jgi:hypothetical protein
MAEGSFEYVEQVAILPRMTAKVRHGLFSLQEN